MIYANLKIKHKPLIFEMNIWKTRNYFEKNCRYNNVIKFHYKLTKQERSTNCQN